MIRLLLRNIMKKKEIWKSKRMNRMISGLKKVTTPKEEKNWNKFLPARWEHPDLLLAKRQTEEKLIITIVMMTT